MKSLIIWWHLHYHFKEGKQTEISDILMNNTWSKDLMIEMIWGGGGDEGSSRRPLLTWSFKVTQLLPLASLRNCAHGSDIRESHSLIQVSIASVGAAVTIPLMMTSEGPSSQDQKIWLDVGLSTTKWTWVWKYFKYSVPAYFPPWTRAISSDTTSRFPIHFYPDFLGDPMWFTSFPLLYLIATVR